MSLPARRSPGLRASVARLTTGLLSLGLLALPMTLRAVPAAAHLDDVSTTGVVVGRPAVVAADARGTVTKKQAKKAYASAVAAETRAAERLARARAAIAAAERDFSALRARAVAASAALSARKGDLGSLWRETEGAQRQVERATQWLDEVSTGDEASEVAEARRALDDARAALADLEQRYVLLEAETVALEAESGALDAAVGALLATAQKGTVAEQQALESAMRRTTARRATLAQRTTPASTKRAPYVLARFGREVAFWDACSGPITVKVSTPGLRGQRSRSVAVAEARTAVAQLKKVSGLPLSFRGRTSEVPRATQPVRSADIVISYTSPRASPALGLGGGRVGLGGSWSSTDVRGQRLRFAGFAAVDAQATQRWKGPAYPKRIEAVLHELGHAIGLGHAPRSSELMFAAATADMPGTFGVGDRNGFRRLRAHSRC